MPRVTGVVRRRRTSVRLLTVATPLAALLVAGCGSVAKAPEEPAARPSQIRVEPPAFSAKRQLPGDQVTLSLKVTNTGTTPIRNLIVTLSGTRPNQLPLREPGENPNDIPQGTTNLPNSVARESWFIDDGPNNKPLAGGESWDGGALAAGESTTLRWSMAAITPGTHTLVMRVAGGLTDNDARATSGVGLVRRVTATIEPPTATDEQ